MYFRALSRLTILLVVLSFGSALFAQRVPPNPPRNPRQFPSVVPQNQLETPYFRDIIDPTVIDDPPPGGLPGYSERYAAAARVRFAVEEMLRESAQIDPEVLGEKSNPPSNAQLPQLRERLRRIRKLLNGIARRNSSGPSMRVAQDREPAITLAAFQHEDNVEDVLSVIHAAINSGDHRQASEQALLELETHPGEGRLWYLLGLALYKQNENEQALICVETAIEVGLDRPSLHQLRGEILFALGRFQDALTALQNAPKDGRTAVTRAASYRELGRDREALAVANEALSKLDLTVAQNKALGATSHLIAAGAHLRSGNLESAVSRVNSATRLASGQTGAASGVAELAQDLGTIGTRTDPRERGYAAYRRRGSDPFGITVTPTYSYTSNGTFSSTPTDDSVFGVNVYGWNRLVGDDHSGLIAFASAGMNEYVKTDVSDDALFDGGFDLYHATGSWYFGGKAAYRYQIVADSPYQNTLTGQLRATYTQSDASRTGFTFQYDDRDYSFAANPFEARDGSLYRWTLIEDLFFDVDDRCGKCYGNVRNLRLSPYVQFGIDNTLGSSSEHEFWGLGISGNWTVDEQTSLFGWANYTDRDFGNPHVRTNFLFDRDDVHTGVGLGVTENLSDRASLTLTWSWFDQNSRVDQFDYNTHEITLSLIMELP